MKKSIIILALILSVLLAGCGEEEDTTEPEPTLLPPSAYSSQRTPSQPSFAPEVSVPAYQPSTYAGGEELFARTESVEAAKEIAELYGIELVNCQNGYATFHTDESPSEVIRRGEANGWPRLEINRIGNSAQAPGETEQTDNTT